MHYSINKNYTERLILTTTGSTELRKNTTRDIKIPHMKSFILNLNEKVQHFFRSLEGVVLKDLYSVICVK